MKLRKYIILFFRSLTINALQIIKSFMSSQTVLDFLMNIRSGEIDYSEFMLEAIEKSKKLNAKYGFFREICGTFDTSHDEPLFGLPVSVKDNICVRGMQTCAGSKILEGYMPPYDATAVSRILKGGGEIIGKTNQDEFGFGTFCANSAYGIPKNPHDPERSCGGSSGGAAGLTAAADFPHIALAQSTGGSISCPAAFCGVVGITPTYGLVSRYGLVDYASSLDKIGTIGKKVWDCAFLLSRIAGHDPKDSTSVQKEQTDYTKGLGTEIKGMKIGVPREYFSNVNSDIEKGVWNAIHKMESLGAEHVKVSLPNTKYALSSYYIIASSEASTNLAKFCGMRYGMHEKLNGNFNEYFSKVRTDGFGEEAKRRIILGTFARMSGYRDKYYIAAQKARTLVIRDFKKAFSKCDILAAPTMPILAPKFSEIKELTPAQQYQMDILTVPANLAGMPMISVPCGFSGKLPIGLHMIGDHLAEEKILQAAYAFERAM
jgi:aspartyl-tRNA(Asn)/glutamyl-tRNA(Gln) amidotransferase subunit A